jgi:hypothetical protein
MAFNPAVALAYKETYNPDELAQIRADCLEVHQNSGTVQRHYEGGSLTVDPKNCEVILENVMEAIRMQKACAAGLDPVLTQPSFSVALDFRRRRLT